MRDQKECGAANENELKCLYFVLAFLIFLVGGKSLLTLVGAESTSAMRRMALRKKKEDDVKEVKR